MSCSLAGTSLKDALNFSKMQHHVCDGLYDAEADVLVFGETACEEKLDDVLGEARRWRIVVRLELHGLPLLGYCTT